MSDGRFFLHLEGAEFLFTLRQNGKISATEFMIGMSLCTFADKDGKCWPSRRRIGECVGVHRDKTLSAAIAALADAGFITVQKTLGRSNDYTIQDPERLVTGGGKRPGRLMPPGAESAPGGGAENAPGGGAENAPHNEFINESINESSMAPKIAPTASKASKPARPTAAKVMRKGEDIPAFVEWKAVRKQFARLDPLPGPQNLKYAKKLMELVPDSDERMRIMRAFFLLDDKDGWLAKAGFTLTQLVNWRLEEARQAAANTARGDLPFNPADPYADCSPAQIDAIWALGEKIDAEAAARGEAENACR
jgi:hypothetical protein